MKFTNTTDIPLSIAVWLAHDAYDHNPDPQVISATALLKPLKAIILGKTLPSKDTYDLSDFTASKAGTAVHDSIEYAWKNHAYESLKKLGLPENVYNNIIINPDPTVIHSPNAIPVHMEIRGHKKILDFTISGKFDFAMEGQIEDFKNTSVWTWIFDSNANDYIMQGSIYRWLFPEIITQDTIAINYIFSDWKKGELIKKGASNYPPSKIVQKKYKLMSIADTERWLTHRINQINKLSPLPQNQLPDCNQEELWQKDATWKYYKNPKSKSRSTKNFTNSHEAAARLSADGNVGIVEKVDAEVKRCNYCSAQPVCLQAEMLEFQGLLTIT